MIQKLCFSAFALSGLTLTLLAAAPAEAQSRREMAERIDAAEVRLGTLEDRFLAGDPVVETLMRRLDDLDYQVRELTARSEQLSFENRQLRDEVDRLKQAASRPRPQDEGQEPGAGGTETTGEAGELEDAAVAWMREGIDENVNPEPRLANPDDPYARDRAAATGVLGGPASIGPERAPPVRIEPGALYDTARAQLLDGDFDGAQEGFEQFVADYPDHARAGEAWYWLGETFFVRSDLAEAADAYIASLRANAQGPKAPDALVRLAASLNGLGRQADACATLGRFGSQFPNADAESRQRAARESVRAGCR